MDGCSCSPRSSIFDAAPGGRLAVVTIAFKPFALIPSVPDTHIDATNFFRLEDGYAALCEQSPDENDLTRLDQVVFQLAAGNKLLKCFMVESKRRGAGSAHIVEAERQARAGATRAIKQGGIVGSSGIFAMTTWRTHCRLWHMGTDAISWTAVDGGPTAKGDRESYLEIGVPEHRAKFDRFIQDVKNLQAATGAAQPWQDPSQPGPALHTPPSAQEAQYPQDEQHLYGAGTQPEYFIGEWVEESAAEPAEQFVETKYYGAGGGPSTQASQTQPWVKVNVKVEKHLTRPDVCVFDVENGRRRIIERRQWEQTEHDGQTVWAYHGKRTTYFTRQAI